MGWSKLKFQNIGFLRDFAYIQIYYYLFLLFSLKYVTLECMFVNVQCGKLHQQSKRLLNFMLVGERKQSQHASPSCVSHFHVKVVQRSEKNPEHTYLRNIEDQGVELLEFVTTIQGK